MSGSIYRECLRHIMLRGIKAKSHRQKAKRHHTRKTFAGNGESRYSFFLNSSHSTANGRGAGPSSRVAANDHVTTLCRHNVANVIDVDPGDSGRELGKRDYFDIGKAFFQ